MTRPDWADEVIAADKLFDAAQEYFDTLHDQIAPLSAIADESIAQTIVEGHRKYPDQKWRELHEHEHLAHALQHLNHHGSVELYYPTPTNEDLQHALTRIAMVLWQRKNTTLPSA